MLLVKSLWKIIAVKIQNTKKKSENNFTRQPNMIAKAPNISSKITKGSRKSGTPRVKEGAMKGADLWWAKGVPKVADFFFYPDAPFRFRNLIFDTKQHDI